MRKKISKIDYITSRSILARNVENMLEFINSKKQQAKNNSEDIFASFGDSKDEKINWDLKVKNKTKLEVLKEEKSSLGVYMTGNPLENYIKCLELLRKITSSGRNLHIAVIDKTKKIFTKAGAMMFALQLTTTEEEIEGVIFPKKAPVYSPILEENQLYWIIGNIDDKGRKKSEEKKEVKPATIDTTEDGVEESVGEVTEYVEKPKLLVSHIARFEDGFVEFLKSFDAPPKDEFIDQFPNIDWSRFVESTDVFDQYIEQIEELEGKYEIKSRGFRKKSGNFKTNPHYKKFVEKQEALKKEKEEGLKNAKKLKVTLYKSLGEKIAVIKKSLIKEFKEGYVAIELYVETQGGDIKKVKGDWYLPRSMFLKK